MFVETVRIQSFGCVRDATLELTRLHALIGPNDSGKSTVLAALANERATASSGTPISWQARSAQFDDATNVLQSPARTPRVRAWPD